MSDPTPRERWTPPGDPRRIAVAVLLGSFIVTLAHPFVKMLREHDVLVDRLAAGARTP